MNTYKIHRWPLFAQIFLAIFLAVLAGIFFGKEGGILLHPIADLTSVFGFIGNLFLRALKMLIVPLIASAIITGISEVGNQGGFARLGMKTLGWYLLTSLFAVLIGLLLVNLFHPGIVDGVSVRELAGLQKLDEAKMQSIGGRGAKDLVDIFLRMIPTNVVSAAAKGQLLGLISFCLLFGILMSRLPKKQAESLRNVWDGIYGVMIKMTDLVMMFAPIGVFGLVAKTIGTTGFSAARPLVVFFITVVLGLLIHALVVLPILLKTLGNIRPAQHFRNMSDALLTAFSTSSSSATLPRTMECVQKNAGVSKKISSFTLPLGATVNMDGTALYECVTAVFIAQAYGLDLSWTQQFVIVWTALITSIGVAGIPSASLVAIVLILGIIGLPAEGIGLVMVVDRILDMFRTTVNVFSDSCAAVVIAKSEKKE